MQLGGLTSAYYLTPLKVSPTELLLDPTNPRFITESTQEREYTAREIRSRAVQDHVRALVCAKEHDVKRLIKSIEDMGFVGGLHEIIVKDVGHGGPYLVVEGNRRAAALQNLLARESTLRPDVRESIRTIGVKEFHYRANDLHTEEKVIDVLLGSIHIDGPKEWGALEKAHYVRRSYVRVWGERKALRYNVDTARAVGSSFKMNPKAVHKYLMICGVYEQLRRAKLPVDPRHYTLIDLATSIRAVAVPYFELDAERCELSDAGLERLAQLIVGEHPPIHNPKLFKMFVEVYKYGTPFGLSEVVEGRISLELSYDVVRLRKQRRAFQEDLEDIKERIRGLSVDGVRGTEAEKALIWQIKTLVAERLMPLTKARR